MGIKAFPRGEAADYGWHSPTMSLTGSVRFNNGLLFLLDSISRREVLFVPLPPSGHEQTHTHLQ